MGALKRGDLVVIREHIPGVPDHRQQAYRAKYIGEVRPPKAGEWFIVERNGMCTATRAKTDLASSLPIAEIVKVERWLVKPTPPGEEIGYGEVDRITAQGATVRLVHRGLGQAPWDDKPRPKFTVILSQGDNQAELPYWGSPMMREKHTAREARAADALRAVVDDALLYLQARDIDDFATQLGFERPSELLRAWEACQNTAKTLRDTLGWDEASLAAIIEELDQEEE